MFFYKGLFTCQTHEYLRCVGKVKVMFSRCRDDVLAKSRICLAHQYQHKLNETDLSGIMLALNELTGDIPPQQCTINKLVDEINSVYTSRASYLGMLKCGQTPIGTKKHRVRTFPHRDWYDDECETKRKIFVKYKN